MIAGFFVTLMWHCPAVSASRNRYLGTAIVSASARAWSQSLNGPLAWIEAMISSAELPPTTYVTTLAPEPKNEAPIEGIGGGSLGVAVGAAANWVGWPFAM